jgi:probable rRNA maturation factor
VSSQSLKVEFACRVPATEVDLPALECVLRELLRAEGVRSGEVSVAIVSDAEIHALNRRYLNHDYPTDVLSFLLERQADRLQGEIIVSIDTARDRCREFGWPASYELTLYVIHGALHLVGYDDSSAEDRDRMRQREAHYLSLASCR